MCRTKVAPVFQQMNVVILTNDGGTGKGPGHQFEPYQPAKQAHAVPSGAFVTNASTFAAFELQRETGFAGLMFLQPEHRLA